MKRIYVAGPLTGGGNVGANVRAAIDAADKLIAWGFAPYIPHLSHFQHIICPRSYETWMKLDLEWLAQCDALLRLPGQSFGADREVEMAFSLGISIFYSLRELLEAMK